MTIIDDGVERRVDSGFIDITARDSSGEIVVIELKAGVAGPQAITQALSYMGDVLAEEEGCKVRGILIAAGFDAKSRAAARMIPNLLLLRYSVNFKFSDGHLQDDTSTQKSLAARL
jgi:RecB family endonuclease NucS